jgi:hypothetical protein
VTNHNNKSAICKHTTVPGDNYVIRICNYVFVVQQGMNYGHLFYKAQHKLSVEIKVLLSWILWISCFVTLHALVQQIWYYSKVIYFIYATKMSSSALVPHTLNVRYRRTVVYYSQVCLWSTCRHNFTWQNPLVGKLHPSNCKPKLLEWRGGWGHTPNTPTETLHPNDKQGRL